MIKKLCLTTILVLSFLLNAKAQITAFDFNGIATAPSPATFNATTTIANTVMSVISKGSGVTASATPPGNAFSGVGFDANSLSTAITNNDYFQFTLSANSTYKISLSSLEATFRRSGSGPSSFQWRYSINGGANFIDIGTPISYTLNTSNGDVQTPLVLSSILDLQDVANPTTIIIRLYGWGATSATGTFAIGRLAGNDLAIGGTVSTTLPLITLGTQTQMVSCLGVPVNKTVTVSGTNLTGSAIVFGPMANYGFSKVPGGPFYATDSITYSGTTLASSNIYIQYTSTTTGTDTVNIPVGGGGDTALLSSPRLTNVLPNVIISSSPVSAAVCPGGSVTLAGTGATTYSWSGSITDNLAFVPSATQTYTVTGSDGTCSNTASIQVVVNTLPTVTATATPTVVCSGSNAILSGAGASTYTWDNGVTDNTTFYPTSTLTYIVTGTDANNCTNTTSISLPVNNLPNITANATSLAICNGDYTTLTGGNGVSYTWTGGVVENTPFNPTATNTYTVTGIDANSCSNTASIQIVVNQLPTVTANSTSTFVCEGSPITLTGGGTATSFTWDNSVVNNVAFNPTTTTTYMVTGSDANSCTNTATIEVIVNLKPSITISTTLPNPMCNESSFGITGNFVSNTLGNTATNITFAGGNGSFLSGTDNDFDGVNETFTTLLNATSNVYTVTATDIASCTSTTSITISGIINPPVTAMVMPASICANQLATVMGGGASTYVWNNGVIDNSPFIGTTTTTYQVIGTDAVGCSATSTVQLVVNNIATNLVTSSSSTTINQVDGSIVNYTNSSCELIATVNDGANGNVLGSLTSNVTITPSVGIYNSQPYVRRWYEITPTNNGAATVTLYLTQADFDDYNSNNGAFLDLPTSGNNADPNIANIRITKVDGALGTGTPLVITPTMNWNGNYWEATFNVTSFSQFYFHSVNPLNSALPATIANFKAVENENKDIISWNTVNEFNNNYFNVLYSTNGVDYKSISKIESKAINGNSQMELSYLIENNATQLGHNYYKLQQVDFDGKAIIYSQVLDVFRNQNGSTVSVYPNPATDVINIKMYNTAATKTTIQLIDMSGRKLKEVATTSSIGNNEIALDIQDVSTGLYLIQILENGKLVSSNKIRK